MQGAWRVIDCSELEGRISYERGRMRVTRAADGVQTDVPLVETAVVLLGLKVQCSAGVLHQFASNNVSVLVCNWQGVPVAAFHPWTDTYTNVTARHIAQVRQPRPRVKQLWARIIKAKIRGQAACLEALGRPQAKQLFELAKTVRSGDTSNVEGQAARLYWQSVFGEPTFRRIPQQRLPGHNSHLDYAYTVLRGFATKSVISAGLAPMFGVNHHNRGNYFCLVDDLIEPFRPAIDYQVAQLDPEALVSEKTTKAFLVDAVNQQMNGKGLTIPSELDKFAQNVGMYFEQKIDVVDVPCFRGLK